MILGEPTRVVKELTEILTGEEKLVFILFPREERGQKHRVALALKGGRLSLLLSLKGQDARKRGWVDIYSGTQLSPGWLCFYRMCFF